MKKYFNFRNVNFLTGNTSRCVSLFMEITSSFPFSPPIIVACERRENERIGEKNQVENKKLCNIKYGPLAYISLYFLESYIVFVFYIPCKTTFCLLNVYSSVKWSTDGQQFQQ